jgi:predicted HTH transcriptional regulator
MTEKDIFIKIVDYEVFSNDFRKRLLNVFSEEEMDIAEKYWQSFIKNEETSVKITENGKKILLFMQENEEAMNNMFTSKEIAEAFFTSGRSVAGSMRKLVSDKFVSKEGKDPIRYSLTETGKNLNLKN